MSGTLRENSCASIEEGKLIMPVNNLFDRSVLGFLEVNNDKWNSWIILGTVFTSARLYLLASNYSNWGGFLSKTTAPTDEKWRAKQLGRITASLAIRYKPTSDGGLKRCGWYTPFNPAALNPNVNRIITTKTTLPSNRPALTIPHDRRDDPPLQYWR